MTNPRKIRRASDRGWLSEWEASKDARDDERTFVTTYCNRSHKLVDGTPVAHECITLPPAALAAERAGDFDSAARIMLAAKITKPIPALTHKEAREMLDTFKGKR